MRRELESIGIALLILVAAALVDSQLGITVFMLVGSFCGLAITIALCRDALEQRRDWRGHERRKDRL